MKCELCDREVKKLKAEEKIKTWIEWVRKKNPNNIKYHGKAKFHN